MVLLRRAVRAAQPAQVFQAAELNDNPDNTRDILRDFSQPRGSITTADGVVLARSVPSGDRFEYQREYPEGAAVRPRHRASSASRSAARASRRPTTTSWPGARSSCRSRSSATCSSTRTASATSPSRCATTCSASPPSSSASARARWWRSTRAPARSSPWCRSRPTTRTCWPTTTPGRGRRPCGSSTPTPRSPGSPAPTRSASSPAPRSRW